jgi:hypothetical protein
MAQFVVYDKRVEVTGEAVLSIVKAMVLFKKEVLKVLSDNGIDNPGPGKWYSQQSWLNVFKTFSEKLGTETLFSIGKMIPENAKWPPQIRTLEEALPSIDVAYHLNHRIGAEVLVNYRLGIMKEGIGHYNYEKKGFRSARMICDNPYPCDFDRGIIEAIVDKYKPPDCKSFSVKHDDIQPCRKKGHNSCTYIVKW